VVSYLCELRTTTIIFKGRDGSQPQYFQLLGQLTAEAQYLTFDRFCRLNRIKDVSSFRRERGIGSGLFSIWAMALKVLAVSMSCGGSRHSLVAPDEKEVPVLCVSAHSILHGRTQWNK
jgi:hypothetical protein